MNISEVDDKKPGDEEKTKDHDLEGEEMNLNVELKIVEDEEIKDINVDTKKSPDVVQVSTTENTTNSSLECINMATTNHDTITDPSTKAVLTHEDSDDVVVRKTDDTTRAKITNADSEGDILSKVSFPKVDISKYRRNSSVNDDDIRLRRGNLEDFHSLSNKRSKSLTNTLDPVYVAFDINLNGSKPDIDSNGNVEPQKVICKLYDEPARKQSIDNSISSTEKEFIEIDRATRELEREISKLNSALIEDEEILTGARLSVTDIKRRFDNNNASPPNPIPKPRRSHYGGNSPDHV